MQTSRSNGATSGKLLVAHMGESVKGATVAKLFQVVSDGDSFVPLRSSANRDEGAQSEV